MIGVGTAFIAAGFSNIMVYIQTLFGLFNAPVFATFIVAMFWKRCSPWAGISGLVAGFLGALSFRYLISPQIMYFHAGQTADGAVNAQMVNFYAAMAAFVADLIVTVVVTLLTKPKPVSGLGGLVYGVPDPNAPDPSTVKKVPL